MSEDNGDAGFLNRWAKRKAEAPAEETAARTEEAPAAEAPTFTEAEEAEIVAGLPDIDSLDETSDFTPFLQQGVPDLLRRRALRVLWRSNPVFANLDGMNEYDEDYTLATSALQAVKTAYQVGKGFITDEERAEMNAEIDGDVAAPGTEEAAEDEGTDPQEISEAEAEAPEPVRESESRDPDPAPSQDEALANLDNRPDRGSARARRWGA